MVKFQVRTILLNFAECPWSSELTVIFQWPVSHYDSCYSARPIPGFLVMLVAYYASPTFIDRILSKRHAHLMAIFLERPASI
jgi:hypothetical protein